MFDDNALLTTAEAAAFLRFNAQTLRRWACYQNGPIQPVRLRNKLRWRGCDLNRLVGTTR